ncbi:MAG TPA: QacE family quaternary ammonium compound efflux SMR transporter [Halothiobacillaceae bacterium]|nr:QacE family quaternary ammonium compound efflux SMR transporter [Halothiobacillaceae bacterium]
MSTVVSSYLALGLAIVLEVVGTSALQASQQFTRLWPTIIMLVSYVGAFYFLALALRILPVGLAYAIWAGLGIVLIAIVGLLFFGQRLDTPAVIGLALIISGVVIINVFSKTVAH